MVFCLMVIMDIQKQLKNNYLLYLQNVEIFMKIDPARKV